MKVSKFIMDDGTELVVGEKYWFWDGGGSNAREGVVCGVDNDGAQFHRGGDSWYSNISKTDPNDKRQLLKDYCVCCKDSTEKGIFMEFCGDMVHDCVDKYSGYKHMYYNGTEFTASKYQVPDMQNINFQELCELCDIDYHNKEVLDQIAVMERKLAKLKEKVS